MKNLRRKGFDGDARFTLFLSLLVGTLTLGLSHVFVFLRVRKRAMTSQHTSNNVTAIAVPGHQLKNGEISTDYQLRLDRVANLYRESDDAIIRIIGGRPSLGISEAQAGNQYERLQTLARGLDFVTRPCAAEESIDLPLVKLLTETLFLHWYWAGRIYATVTHNHRMLDKIR